MSVGEKLTNKLYTWVVLYPWFRRLVNWAYSDVMKMPQYHIGLVPGQIGEDVLLVDDPADAERAAAHLENAEETANHREYRTFTGMLHGKMVSVTSLGVGGPPAAIGVHELATIGAKQFVYVGNGFCPAKGIKKGEMAVVTGAVREEGTALQYAPLAIPALCDPSMADKLREACKRAGAGFRVGLTRSTNSYYNAKREGESAPFTLCSDLSSAAILITARVLKTKAAVLLTASDSLGPLSEDAIKIGLAVFSSDT